MLNGIKKTIYFVIKLSSSLLMGREQRKKKDLAKKIETVYWFCYEYAKWRKLQISFSLPEIAAVFVFF